MRIAYGYVISDREYGVERASDRLLDAVRDELGVPRDKRSPRRRGRGPCRGRATCC